MIGVADLAFAQARIQARHGVRVGESTWRMLSATAAFRGFLEQARSTALRPWLLNISSISTKHDIERLLRDNLHGRIAEVAGWVPPALRPAVRWTAALIELPALDYLLHGGAALSWMRDEPRLRSTAAVEPGQRAAVLAQGELAALARGDQGDSLFERWLVEWRRRLPALARSETAHLERLARLVLAALDEAAAHALEPTVHDSSVIRRRLENALTFEFRRRFLEPAAIFAHLLLVILEFAEVRGALVSRVIFEPGVR